MNKPMDSGSNKQNSFEVHLKDIEAARAELSKNLTPTPLLFNPWLSEALGCQLYLKLENMTQIGSFKIRGATYKISKLTDEERKRGVIAASAGNHAQGVAWGSLIYGVNALIVMPKNAPLNKVQNTRALKAELHLEGDNYEEAFAAAQRVQKETGRVFVHAYQDPLVIAGQGTVGLEILDQLPDVDAVIGSIGGGGLMGGVATAIFETRPGVQLIGCQASGAPSMVRSFHENRSVKIPKIETFADGIKVGESSEQMFQLLRPLLENVYEANDEEIASAVLTLLEKAKIVAEGAGALPLAVLQKLKNQFKGKKVVLIVGGGNIDVNVLARIIDRGLTQAGRRLRVNTWISDRPGSLNMLTEILAEQGANVLQVIHDRNEPSTRMDETEVSLTLETRGPEHSSQITESLKKCATRVEVMN